MPFVQGSFWALLGEGDRAALRGVGTVRHHQPGAVLLREGAPADAVVVVLSGQVKVTASAVSGNDAVFAVLGPGDVVGELSSMDGQACTATVSAIGPVSGLAVPPARFATVLDREPRVARALLRVIIARLRQSNRRQVEYGETTAATRLAALLVDLAASHGTPVDADAGAAVEITLPVSQRELAGLITASREAVARALRDLRDEGVVRTGRQRLTVLRPDLLARRASPL